MLMYIVLCTFYFRRRGGDNNCLRLTSQGSFGVDKSALDSIKKTAPKVHSLKAPRSKQEGRRVSNTGFIYFL